MVCLARDDINFGVKKELRVISTIKSGHTASSFVLVARDLDAGSVVQARQFMSAAETAMTALGPIFGQSCHGTAGRRLEAR